MNDLERKLSAALDAISALDESLYENRELFWLVPIRTWHELALQARRDIEAAVELQKPGRVTRFADTMKRRIA